MYANAAPVLCGDIDLMKVRLTFREGGSHFRLNNTVHIPYSMKIEQQESDNKHYYNILVLPSTGH